MRYENNEILTKIRTQLKGLIPLLHRKNQRQYLKQLLTFYNLLIDRTLLDNNSYCFSHIQG